MNPPFYFIAMPSNATAKLGENSIPGHYKRWTCLPCW